MYVSKVDVKMNVKWREQEKKQKKKILYLWNWTIEQVYEILPCCKFTCDWRIKMNNLILKMIINQRRLYLSEKRRKKLEERRMKEKIQDILLLK